MSRGRAVGAGCLLAAAAASVCIPFTACAGAPDPDRHHRVHVLYVTTRDREPLPAYRERLHRVMVDVQEFYRAEMERHGYGPLTVPLDVDGNGRVRVRVVTLDHDFDPDVRWTPDDLTPHIRDALAADGLDLERTYFVTFLNAYWRDGERWMFDVAYTGGGDARRGTTWVTDHILLDRRNLDPALTDGIDDRGHRLTVAAFNAKMIGGVAHELGHALGLPHNRERADEKAILGRALMGVGNYTYRRDLIGSETGSFITAAHAFILSLHPLFTGNWPGVFNRPDVTFPELSFTPVDDELAVMGRVTPNEPVAGVVLYHDPLPTGMNRDYDARSVLATFARDGRFAARVPAGRPGETALHLKVYFRTGLYRTFSLTHTVAGTGDWDVAALERDAAWIQAKTAFACRDLATLTAAAELVRRRWPERSGNAERLHVILQRWHRFPIPSQLPADVRELCLSEARWRTAETGWLIPSFGAILDPEGAWMTPFFSTAGPADYGLYAHARSRYEYDIGGTWTTFRGGGAVQKGHRGSVVFVVRGDGRELFRSGLVRLKDGVVGIEVPIAGVRFLELLTEPGDDGKRCDWGIWVEPVLLR